MNRVDISIEGPIMEGLARVVISDNESTDTFCVDHADVEDRRREGPSSLLDLVVDNAASGIDILLAARDNGSPVVLDGADLDPEILRTALETPQPAA